MRKIIILSALFTISLSMLATDMVVKQKNGEIKRFNVEDVEEVIFNENVIIPNDSTVADTSEIPLTFSVTSDSTVEVTGSKKKLDSIEIPSKVKIDGKAYTVNSIGSEAFKNDNLTSVKIPSSVTKIDIYAFFGCKDLTSIDIPASVTEIKDGAFSSCFKMTSINAASDNPNFITVDGVLYNKDTTELISAPAGIDGKFVIPSTVTSIRGAAFMGCAGMDLITVPSSVTKIGDGAFWNCMNIVIENKSKDVEFGGFAFVNCFSIRFTKDTPVVVGNPDLSVVMDTSDISELSFKLLSDSTVEVMCSRGIIDTFYIPAKIRMDDKIYTVTKIADNAFDGVGGGNLKGIKLPSTITSIGNESLAWCEMESIEIPSSVTEIGEKAFWNCQNFRTVRIPSNVTRIGKEAFLSCLYLDIVIDNSQNNVEVGEDAFKGCKSVTWAKE